MDSIHVNLSAMYQIVQNVVIAYAVYWAIPKVIRLFKK
jgi:hypothetical protein